MIIVSYNVNEIQILVRKKIFLKIMTLQFAADWHLLCQDIYMQIKPILRYLFNI